MSLDRFFSTLKGGAGSGNFGHAGIPGKRGGSSPGGGGSGSFEPYKNVRFSSRQPTDVKKGDKVIAHVSEDDPDFDLPSHSSNMRGKSGNLIPIGTKGTVVEKYDADPYQDAEVHIKWDNGDTSKYAWGEYSYGRKNDSVDMERLNNSLSEKFRILE